MSTPAPKRFRLRFSLRSLLLLLMAIASAAAVAQRWQPWQVVSRTPIVLENVSSYNYAGDTLIYAGHDGMWVQNLQRRTKVRLDVDSPIHNFVNSRFRERFGTLHPNRALCMVDALTGKVTARTTFDQEIRTAVMDAKGENLIILFDNSSVASYSARTLERRQHNTKLAIRDLQLSADDKWVIARTADSVCVLNIETLEVAGQLPVTNDDLRPVTLAGRQCLLHFLPSAERWMRVYALPECAVAFEVACPQYAAYSLTPDSRHLWLATYTKRLIALDGMNGNTIHDIAVNAEINWLACSSDSKRLYAWNNDDNARTHVWDTASGQLLEVLEDKFQPGESGFSADGNAHSQFEDQAGQVSWVVRHRVRAEGRMGLAMLPQLWLLVLFSGGLLVSLWRDFHSLRAPAQPPPQPV